MEIGDKVIYNQVYGTISSIINDMAIVKLEDGKEYTVYISDLQSDNNDTSKTYTVNMLKNDEFQERLAKDMLKAGIEKIVIDNGEITEIAKNLTLEECIEIEKAIEKEKHLKKLEKIEEKIRREHEAGSSKPKKNKRKSV